MKEIQFVDASIGAMETELKKQNLAGSTLFIITAKHGQSPVDTSRYKPNGSPNDPATIISSCLPDSELNQIGPTEDDVALLWLDPHGACTAAEAVNTLETASPLSDESARSSRVRQFNCITTMAIRARRTFLLLRTSA
jgi:hypothetical protein